MRIKYHLLFQEQICYIFCCYVYICVYVDVVAHYAKYTHKKLINTQHKFNVQYCALYFTIMDITSSTFFACLHGNIETLKRNITIGFNVNAIIYNNTLLDIACMHNQYDIAKYLLENNANVNAKIHHGRSPLYYASTNGDYNTVKLLLDNGANINDKDNNNFTALDTAYLYGHTNVADLLLNYGINLRKVHRKYYINKELKKRLYILSLIVQKDVFKYHIIININKQFNNQ